MTPYEILNVPESADDALVKQAYLTLVRQYPPDRAPERFEKITAAYEMVKTAKQRVAYELFHQPPVPTIPEIIEALGAVVLQDIRFGELPLKDYLWNSFDAKG